MISRALSELRLADVDGPYSVLLSAEAYTKVSETTEHGYPLLEHLNRLVDGEIIWAPAHRRRVHVSTRGGDFDLRWAPTCHRLPVPMPGSAAVPAETPNIHEGGGGKNDR